MLFCFSPRHARGGSASELQQPQLATSCPAAAALLTARESDALLYVFVKCIDRRMLGTRAGRGTPLFNGTAPTPSTLLQTSFCANSD